MRNLLLTLCFDGSAYHGWQVQENAVTVQSTLQDAVHRILGVRENIIGCSRTDAGVHAEMFCCNMRTEKEMPPEKLQTALNAVLPRNIAVLSVKEVPYEFHARYDCKGKVYKYLIWNARTRSPFYENRAYHYPWPLDVPMLNEQIRQFLGQHDFSAFCASGSSVEDRVREITRAEILRNGDLVEIYIGGNGFLYNMVRIMVGTLLDIQSGAILPNSIPEILEQKNRKNAGVTAPAHGLYLHQVNY